MDFNAQHLIRLVRELPQIYDSSLADFKIPEKKDQAWNKVAVKLNTSGEYIELTVPPPKTQQISKGILLI